MKLCKLDVAKVVLDKIYDDHMRGREIFSRLTDDTFRLVKVTPAKDRKATHRDQAFAIINRLITDLKEEWGNTIFVIPYEDDGEFGPIDIKISVYDLAIDKLYHSIPEEARLEPVNEHYFFDDPALDQQALAEEWNLQIAKPIVETPTASIKPGVPELFESNPELANAVYEVLGFETIPVGWEKGKTLYDKAKPVKIDFKSGITTLPNGNYLVRAYRTDNTGLGSKGFGQRGEGLYLSLTNPYPGRDVNTVEFEIAPSDIITYKEEFFGTIPYEKLTGGKGNFQDRVALAGGKAFIGGINSSEDSNLEIVLYDKTLINKALQSKKKVSNFTTKYLLYDLITPQQKQQAQQLYSQYLEQNPNGSVKQFKNWIDEFNRNKNNLEQQSKNKTIDEIYKEKPYLKEFIDSVTDESSNISIYKVKNTLDKHGEGRIVKLNKILYNAINRLWDNNVFAQNNIKIKFVDSLPENAVGNFNRDDNEITIDKRKFLNNVIDDDRNYPIFYLGYILNHEIIHYLTPKDLSLKIEYVDRALNGRFGDTFRLESEKEFGRNIKELYDVAIEKLDNVEDYGFLNLAEFVAEAMSNPSFQEKLASIPFKTSKQSLWKRFIKILSDYLSLDTKKPITDTLLEAVIAETTNYITENSNIQRTYKRRKSGKTENIDIGYDFVYTTQKNINTLSDFISQKSQERLSQIKDVFNENPEFSSQIYEALGFNNLGKEYSNVIIDQVWKRLASEGITNADSLIGTRETINNKDFNKFWSAVKDVDIQNVINFFKAEKQKALDSFSKYQGEFDPTTGTFTSNDTSFFDKKIKDLNTLLQQKQQAQQLYSQYLDSLNKPNTNPILQTNQKEQVKKFAELQERLNNKEFLEGAKNAYENSEGLKSFGTQEEYNDYIARVSLGIIKNPSSGDYNYTSRVKDIVYHGTNAEFEKFDKTKFHTSKAFHFSNLKETLLSKIKKPVLLNILNPIDEMPSRYEQDVVDDRKKQGYDGTITDADYKEYERKPELGKEYVVFEPEQIHILGSKQDIEGFKEFIKSEPVFENGQGKLFQTNTKYQLSLNELRLLEPIHDKFKQDIEEFILYRRKGQFADKFDNGYIFNLGNPSSILQSVGFPNLPITISDSRLSNHLIGKKEHNLILGNLKDLVEAIHNPIALFQDKNFTNRINILTNIKNSKGQSVQVIIALEKDFGKKDRLGFKEELKVNAITTAFAPENSFNVEKNILEDNSLYIDKERLLEYLQGFRQNTKFVYPKSLSEAETNIQKVLWKIQEFPEKLSQEDKRYQQAIASGDTSLLKPATLEQGLSWLKQVLPQANYELVEGLIDEIGNGSYDTLKDLMTFSKEYADKGTVKHEAIHKVLASLPEKKREQILNEASKLFNIPRGETTQMATEAIKFQSPRLEYSGDLAIEEKIAEMAEKSKDEVVPKTLLEKFIQTIKNLLRNLYKEKTKIERLIRDLNQGRFADFTELSLMNIPEINTTIKYQDNNC